MTRSSWTISLMAKHKGGMEDVAGGIGLSRVLLLTSSVLRDVFAAFSSRSPAPLRPSLPPTQHYFVHHITSPPPTATRPRLPPPLTYHPPTTSNQTHAAMKGNAHEAVCVPCVAAYVCTNAVKQCEVDESKLVGSIDRCKHK